MKKTTLAITVFGSLALAAAPALAGEDWEAKLEEKFAKADANGDGAVSEDEFLARVTEKASAEFAEMSGGDGSLTLEEAKAAHKARYEKKKKMKADKES